MISCAHANSLVRLYHEALSYDAQYLSARAQADALREKAPQGLAGLLPSVHAQGSLTAPHNLQEVLTNNQRLEQRFQTNARYAWNLSLSQPIFNWQAITQYAMGQWQVVQAEAQFAQASQDLILRVAQATFDVLYAEENLKAVEREKAAISQQREMAEQNFEIGTATITDAQEAQARYDLSLAREIAAQNELEVKRHALRVMVGKSLGTVPPLKTELRLFPPEPALMEKWVDATETGNFAVQAQKAALELANQDVSRQRGGHLPTVTLVGNYGKNTQENLDLVSKDIGIQVSIPLFQGGGITSKTREAVAGRTAAQANLEHARRTATLGTQQAFLGVVNGLSQIKALDAAVKSSTSALLSNKLGYDVGVRINIDVLNAEQQVYTTTRDLARARFDTLMAQLRLKAAVGTLSEADLEAMGTLFEAP